MTGNGQILELVPTCTLVKADAAALQAHWPWLRERLLDVKATNEYPKVGDRRKVDRRYLATSYGVSGRCRWTPEQIRCAILRGFHGQTTVELFYAIDAREHDAAAMHGFVITTCDPDPIVGVPLDFKVWLLWADSHEVLSDTYLHLDELARERGCTALEHSSPRMGWFRRQRDYGVWTLKYWTWRKDLT